MRALLLAGLLAISGFAFITPVSVSPASAQLRVETPVGDVRVGSDRRRYREYDRRRYRYGVRSRGERCTTTIVRRSDGSTTRIRRCR